MGLESFTLGNLQSNHAGLTETVMYGRMLDIPNRKCQIRINIFGKNTTNSEIVITRRYAIRAFMPEKTYEKEEEQPTGDRAHRYPANSTVLAFSLWFDIDCTHTGFDYIDITAKSYNAGTQVQSTLEKTVTTPYINTDPPTGTFDEALSVIDRSSASIRFNFLHPAYNLTEVIASISTDGQRFAEVSRVSPAAKSYSDNFQFDNLEPNTNYYFKAEAACANGTTSNAVYTAKSLPLLVTSITLDQCYTLNVGETIEITPVISPQNASMGADFSADSDCVSIAGNKVTGLNEGTATLTATAKDGYGATAAAALNCKIPVEGVSFVSSGVQLKENFQLIWSILPARATNKAVTFTSSDESVATVSAIGLVSAHSLGDCSITITTAEGTYTDTVVCTVVDTLPFVNMLSLMRISTYDIDAIYNNMYFIHQAVHAKDGTIATLEVPDTSDREGTSPFDVAGILNCIESDILILAGCGYFGDSDYSGTFTWPTNDVVRCPGERVNRWIGYINECYQVVTGERPCFEKLYEIGGQEFIEDFTGAPIYANTINFND